MTMASATVIMTMMMMTASPAADTVPLQLQTIDVGMSPPAAWSPDCPAKETAEVLK
jgi:hypothetical protein